MIRNPKTPASPIAEELAELYRRHAATVLRRGRRFLPPAEAEELVHEVFLKLVEDPRRLRGEASPTTWMYTVATRLCIDRLRKRARQSRLVEQYAACLPGSDSGESAEARVFLESLWRTLDDELAMVGVLYWVDGMTTADIGRALGVSDRTIANRLTRIGELARVAAGGER